MELFHDATEYFIIFVNKSRNVISENKLFHERLRDELTGVAEFILVGAGWDVGLTWSIPSLLCVDPQSEKMYDQESVLSCAVGQDQGIVSGGAQGRRGISCVNPL